MSDRIDELERRLERMEYELGQLRALNIGQRLANIDRALDRHLELLMALSEQVTNGFAHVGTRLDRIDARLDRIEAHFDAPPEAH